MMLTTVQIGNYFTYLFLSKCSDETLQFSQMTARYRLCVGRL